MIYKLPQIEIICLISTIVIEVIISFIIGIKNKKDLLNIILINIVTNPLVVVIPYIISTYYGKKIRIITLIILEILTILVEGLFYKKVLKYEKINYFMVSLILNISSYLLGSILNNIIW